MQRENLKQRQGQLEPSRAKNVSMEDLWSFYKSDCLDDYSDELTSEYHLK